MELSSGSTLALGQDPAEVSRFCERSFLAKTALNVHFLAGLFTANSSKYTLSRRCLNIDSCN